MLKIDKQGGNYRITVGVEYKVQYQHLKGKVVEKPFTFIFSESDLVNMESLEAKIKFLQRAVDTMPPAKRDRIRQDSLVSEAFETTRFEHEFK